MTNRGTWTEADHLGLGETPSRIELVDGCLLPSPAPTMPHQDVTHVLLHALRSPARRAGLRAYGSAVLMLEPGSFIIPDLVVAKVDRLAGWANAADTVLVGAVTSPGRHHGDTSSRIERCAEAGIPWFLLAKPETPGHEALTLTLFRLKGGHYLEHLAAGPGRTFTTREPFPFRVRTADLVAF